jgi:hypothetical protein
MRFRDESALELQFAGWLDPGTEGAWNWQSVEVSLQEGRKLRLAMRGLYGAYEVLCMQDDRGVVNVSSHGMNLASFVEIALLRHYSPEQALYKEAQDERLRIAVALQNRAEMPLR